MVYLNLRSAGFVLEAPRRNPAGLRLAMMVILAITLVSTGRYLPTPASAEVAIPVATPCGSSVAGVRGPREFGFQDTYRNTTGQLASDLCALYQGSGGTLANLFFVGAPEGCPAPKISQAGGNIVLIDFEVRCVPPGEVVGVQFDGNHVPLQRANLIWTQEGNAIPGQLPPSSPIEIPPSVPPTDFVGGIAGLLDSPNADAESNASSNGSDAPIAAAAAVIGGMAVHSRRLVLPQAVQPELVPSTEICGTGVGGEAEQLSPANPVPGGGLSALGQRNRPYDTGGE